jgi:hypothetical protein
MRSIRRRVAVGPTLPATRRQLLEYLLAFEVHGVLLVDLDEGRVRPVEFPAVAVEPVRY